MALALEGRAMKDDILIGDTPKSVKRRPRLKKMTAEGRLWKHSTLRDVYGLVSQTQIETYFVFCMVRNPWDRIVSHYHWLKEQRFDHPSVSLSKSHGFSNYLNHPLTQNTMKSNPYKSYVQDRAGHDMCSLYIRLEHFGEDVKPLENHLGFSLGKLPLENTSLRDMDYRSYYSAEDADLVGRMCSVDARQFGYRF